jgi:carbon-monoxide dehydrogenase medium subunit
MPDFEYFEPTNIGEACALIAEDPYGSAVLAGGTDVLVNLKEGLVRHRRLVSLRRIEGLERIEYSPRNGLHIGAMATVNQVARHPEVQRHYPGVVDAAMSLAADQVRNLATVAGNICSAVPSADMAPILLAHKASLLVVGGKVERVVPIRDFFRGPRSTILEPQEVVIGIELVPPAAGAGDASLRQGGRESLSLPQASAAACVTIEADTCVDAAVALGAVAPTPIVVPEIGPFLAGKELSESVLAEVGGLASAATRPIDDLRSSAAYRLDLVAVLTRRALVLAAARGRAAGGGR